MEMISVGLATLLLVTLICCFVYYRSVKREHRSLMYIIQNSSDSIFLLNSQGRAITCCNQEHCQPSAVMDCFNAGRNVFEWIDAPSRKRLQTLLVEVGSTRKVQNTQFQFLGDSQENDVTLCPSMGDSIYMIVHTQAITVKSLSNIKNKIQLMEMLLNNLPIPTAVKDLTNRGAYLVWNKKAETQYNCTKGDILSNNTLALSPELEQIFADTDRMVLQEGEYDGIHSITPTGTERIISLHKKLITGKDGHKWVISAALDITEQENQKRLLEKKEKELQEALSKADESNVLKSEFIANMSHEIRTPLNAIVGFSEYMADTESPEERRLISETISTNAQNLVSLIDGIIELSQIKTGERQLKTKPINLTQLINQVMNGGQWGDAGELTCNIEVPEQEYIIDADEEALTYIMNNFLSNAIKYTPKGTITMGYTVTMYDVRFFVKDTGIGIAPEKHRTIFERFEKNGSTLPGLGLGLTICEALTNRMGGEIGVDSQKDEGSTFWIELPCNPRPTEVEIPAYEQLYYKSDK